MGSYEQHGEGLAVSPHKGEKKKRDVIYMKTVEIFRAGASSIDSAKIIIIN